MGCFTNNDNVVLDFAIQWIVSPAKNMIGRQHSTSVLQDTWSTVYGNSNVHTAIIEVEAKTEEALHSRTQ